MESSCYKVHPYIILILLNNELPYVYPISGSDSAYATSILNNGLS